MNVTKNSNNTSHTSHLNQVYYLGKKEAKDALPAIIQKPVLTDRADRADRVDRTDRADRLPNNIHTKAPLCRLREMRRARASQCEQVVEPIEEEDVDVQELVATPEDLSTCTICAKTLSENEKLINTRFINEATTIEEDSAVFPVCFKCNFSNLLSNQRSTRDKKYFTIYDDCDAPIFYPTNKKVEGNLNSSQLIKQTLSPLEQEKLTVEDYFENRYPQKLKPDMRNYLQVGIDEPFAPNRGMQGRIADAQNTRTKLAARITRTSGDKRSHTIVHWARSSKPSNLYTTTNESLHNPR